MGYDVSKFFWVNRATVGYRGFNQENPVQVSFYMKTDGGLSSGGATLSHVPQSGPAEDEYHRLGGHDAFALAAFHFARTDQNRPA